MLQHANIEVNDELSSRDVMEGQVPIVSDSNRISLDNRFN
jgi:hypothetical protein